MLGSNKQFTLERVPFSVSGAFLSIYQPTDEKKLYFSICRSETGFINRPKLLMINLVANGEELPYTYYCDEAKLTLESTKGKAEFTFESPEIMLVRLECVSLRINCVPIIHEYGIERAQDEVELAFIPIGKLLFKVISGSMCNDVRWNFRQACPYPITIEICPGVDGIGEAAIHEYFSNEVAKESYMPFDEAYEKTMKEFEAFYRSYTESSDKYQDMTRLAAWIIWQSRMGPSGSLKNTIIYRYKHFLLHAFGWHHGFHAMAMKNNVKESFNLLMAFFAYQNEHGALPDHVSDMNVESWISTSPPVFGLAVCYMLDHFDLTSLTIEDYQALYEKLSLYADWWLKQRDHTKTGFPSYYHASDSGYGDATLFANGLPLQAADLQAYMVMLCEACGRIAAILSYDEQAKNWMNESKRFLTFLTAELWDGEQFLAKNPGNGTLFKCGSIAQLQPIILGKRLPKEIIAKVKERLLDDKEYLTAYGMASEHLHSDKVDMSAFSRGAVIAPMQCMIILGLFDAGEEDAARKLAACYLDALMIKGPTMGINPFQTEMELSNGIVVEETLKTESFSLSPLVSSIFIILENNLDLL